MDNISGLSPQGLQTLWNLPVGATADAMSLQDQLSRNNDIDQQGALAKLAYDQKMQPMLLEKQDLANQTSRAQLPGIMADSGMKQNQLKVDNETLPDQLKTALAKHGAQQMQAFAKQSTDAGQVLATQGQLLQETPFLWGQTKAHMQQAGMGALADQLEQLDPMQRGLTMKMYGQHMMDQTAAYMQKLTEMDKQGQIQKDVAQVKGNYAQEIADRNHAAKLAQQQERGRQAEAIKKLAAQQGAGRMNLNQLASMWSNLYYQAVLDGDPRADEYKAIADAAYRDVQNAPGAKPGTIDPVASVTAGQPTAATPEGKASIVKPGETPPTADPIGSAAKAAWGEYDTSKYDYRMGPNGIQRKAK